MISDAVTAVSAAAAIIGTIAWVSRGEDTGRDWGRSWAVVVLLFAIGAILAVVAK